MAAKAVTTSRMFSKGTMVAVAVLLAGCSASAPYSADRSDKQAVKTYQKPKPTKTTEIPPGSCPDCGFNGPYPPGSKRPIR